MENNEIIEALIGCNEIIAVALGGSRSRGEHKVDSDFDLFCVILDEKFECFRKYFRLFIEQIPSVKCAAEVFYLENWGYLFKAIDENDIVYDISIIPQNRINEMGIRSTNIVLKDTDKLYQIHVNLADDSQFAVSKLEEQHFLDYVALFGFEKKRFTEAMKKEDYWYGVRCLERMKNYLIRCDRIKRKVFPKSCSCPEKEYIDLNNCLRKVYILNGKLETLVNTSEELNKILFGILENKEICERSQLLC